MGINANRRISITQSIFALGKGIKKPNNFFTRNRQQYLAAVLSNDLKTAFEIETKVFEAIRSNSNPDIANLANTHRDALTRMLRRGFTLPNAIKIAIMKGKLVKIIKSGNSQIQDNPKYRKPEVLKLEQEILETEYVALRLALKKAHEMGLSKQEDDFRKEIEAKARKIAEYNRIFRKRLME